MLIIFICRLCVCVCVCASPGALIPMLVNMFQVKPPLEAVVAICAYCADFARKRAAAARLAQPDKAKEADADAESALSFEDPAQPANNDEGTLSWAVSFAR